MHGISWSSQILVVIITINYYCHRKKQTREIKVENFKIILVEMWGCLEQGKNDRREQKRELDKAKSQKEGC